MAARDDYEHGKHPGQEHLWRWLGTDYVHGTERDVWMCQLPDKCGRDTDPAKRQKLLDAALHAALRAVGHKVEVNT